MEVTILKSKIHQATVTGFDVNYEGSIVVDAALMEEVGLVAYEKVLVANMATGARFEPWWRRTTPSRCRALRDGRRTRYREPS